MGGAAESVGARACGLSGVRAVRERAGGLADEAEVRELGQASGRRCHGPDAGEGAEPCWHGEKRAGLW